jgi:predicted RNA binding protein YcfA (HicA-like mRNA interferase family)
MGFGLSARRGSHDQKRKKKENKEEREELP